MLVLGGGDFGRLLGHEDGALMNGISALIEETEERLSFSAFCHAREGTARSGHLQTRKQALTRQRTCCCLDLGLPSLPNCEK